MLLMLPAISAPAPPPRDRGLTVLIGVDQDPGERPLRATSLAGFRRRADSIVLVRVVAGVSRALWLPRDTLVRMPDGGEDILAHVTRRGGIRLLDAVLWGNFGLCPTSHAAVDFDGFRALVDAIGGLRWPGGETLPGLESPLALGGREALRLVRARQGDPRADLGRIDRQMALTKAFGTTLRSVGPAGIVRTAQLLPRVARTDIPPLGALQLAMAIGKAPPQCARLQGIVEGQRYRASPTAGTKARAFLGLARRVARTGAAPG